MDGIVAAQAEAWNHRDAKAFGIAIVDVTAKLSGFSGLPPVIRAFRDGAVHTQLELVLTKEKAEWWISAYHNVAVLPPPPQQ